MQNATISVGFEDTILPLQPVLMRVALRLTRNSSEARDLVQDALERAFREWDRFTPGTSERAWVTAIMSRLFIDGWRRRRRQPALVTIDDVQVAGATVDPGEGPPPPAWQQVTDADLAWAIGALPDPLRGVFVLNMLQQRSYLEISAALGIPINTVGTRLMRARRRLRGLLQRRIATPISFRVSVPLVPEGAPELAKSLRDGPPQPGRGDPAQSASRSIRARASAAHGAALESSPM